MVTVRIGQAEERLSWEEWEARVRAGRVPPDAEVRVEAITGDAFVPAASLESYRDLRNDDALRWETQFRWGAPPLLTALLVGVQVRIWWMSHAPGARGWLVENFTNWTAPTLEDGQVWRLLSMGLLHTDLFHLVLNMVWLAYTGWNLERAVGKSNLAVLYFASVLGGSLASMYGNAAAPSLGASGGVFGLVAASVAFGFARPELLPERGQRLFGWSIFPYLILMFWSGLQNEGTDNWSHLGGLLTGGALVLALDPEPMQRRPGHNRRARGLTLAGCAVVLIGLWAAGPRAYLLEDSEAAASAEQARRRRRADPPGEPARYRALSAAVPIGWRTGSAVTHHLGFRSPSPLGDRAWSVSESRASAPRGLVGLEAEVRAQLRRLDPSAVVSPSAPARLAGLEGLGIHASLSSGLELDWRFTTRGVWELHEIWQTDAEAAARLAPLAERLRATVRWGEPAELVLASDAVARSPGSWREKARLASALAEVGDADGAVALWRMLLNDHPDDPTVWRGALNCALWYPTAAGDLDPWLARALAGAPPLTVVTEVVEALDRSGDREAAIGLLELSWDRSPGDVRLRTLRRSLGLPHKPESLSADGGVPWALTHALDTGAPRSPAEVAARRARPVDLPNAREVGAAYVQERTRLVERVLAAAEADDPALAQLLVRLRLGYEPPDRHAASLLLGTDLIAAVGGSAPAWLPPELLVEPRLERVRRLAETLAVPVDSP